MNFQGIKYAIKHSEYGHHQVEKMWHNVDITKNWMSLQHWWKAKKNIIREASKRPRAILNELQELIANTGYILHVTKVSHMG